MNNLYLNLGSNINPEENILKALELINQRNPILKCSRFYETPPYQNYDYNESVSVFINCAVLIQSEDSFTTYKHEIIPVFEKKLLRVKDPNNIHADRTIDIDITLFNSEVMPENKCPDPLLADCSHIILPLADIADDYIHPTLNLSIQSLKNHHLKSEPEYTLRTDLTFQLNQKELSK